MRTYFVLLTVLIAGLLFAAEPVNPGNRFSKITTETIRIVHSAYSGSVISREKSEYNYDYHGYLTSFARLDKENKPNYTCKITNNERGYPLKRERFRGNHLLEIRHINPDARGNISNMLFKNYTKTTYKIFECKYGFGGEPIIASYESGEGKLLQKQSFRQEGADCWQTFYDGKELPCAKHSYHIDPDAQISIESCFDIQGNLIQKRIQRYNARKQLVQIEILSGNFVQRRILEYRNSILHEEHIEHANSFLFDEPFFVRAETTIYTYE
ncbi:MAG: hypothetical protein K8S56_05770 [Candidatus Cloacimonetes bacterium]|nr:hypothetical protein [Candidatus Cloacimonadota bacterium]